MKKLIRFLYFFLCSFCVSAQTDKFRSNLDNMPEGVVNTAMTELANPLNLDLETRFFGLASLSKNYEFANTYLIGLSLRTDIMSKINLFAAYDYLDCDYNLAIENYQDSLGIYYPSFGLRSNRFQFNVKYLANKFITVDVGYGKQFIGNGYQSLLLSDVSSPYPFVKLSTKFGPFKYYNLYTTFLNPNMVDYGRKKHAAIHYLDFAITQRIHFGIFESILWQSKSDIDNNNGYELAYLNPVIFYRPVEFSKKSNQGNALIGVDLNVTFSHVMFYGQFMLDDLNISRQKDQDESYEAGFFQNKYGYQLGLRGEMKALKYLLEYNHVQPYTYGHRTILQNYSHMNQALAHPLGANFKELINTIEIKKGKWTYKIKTMLAYVGLDSLDTHYGQNIFESDLEASTGGQYSYGNFNGQGVRTTIFSFQPEVSFKLKWFDVFGLVYYRTKKSDLLDKNSLFYSLGLRTFPFASFQDY